MLVKIGIGLAVGALALWLLASGSSIMRMLVGGGLFVAYALLSADRDRDDTRKQAQQDLLREHGLLDEDDD